MVVGRGLNKQAMFSYSCKHTVWSGEQFVHFSFSSEGLKLRIVNTTDQRKGASTVQPQLSLFLCFPLTLPPLTCPSELQAEYITLWQLHL